MPNWDYNLIGKYIILFIANGIFGYFFQFMGHTLAIHTFNKRKLTFKSFVVMTCIFSVLAYIIRLLPISFGFHTIIIMIVCILISNLVFKTAIYPTVLGVLLTVVSILVFEMVTYSILSIVLSSATVDLYLADTSSIDGSIRKAIMGIPTNIFLVSEMIILYKISPDIFNKGRFAWKK